MILTIEKPETHRLAPVIAKARGQRERWADHGQSGAERLLVTHLDVLIDPAAPMPDWTMARRERDRKAPLSATPWVGDVCAV